MLPAHEYVTSPQPASLAPEKSKGGPSSQPSYSRNVKGTTLEYEDQEQTLFAGGRPLSCRKPLIRWPRGAAQSGALSLDTWRETVRKPPASPEETCSIAAPPPPAPPLRGATLDWHLPVPPRKAQSTPRLPPPMANLRAPCHAPPVDGSVWVCDSDSISEQALCLAPGQR